MNQNKLYYITQLETKVSIMPDQLDSNIDDHMLKNLKEKVEKKCMENGIVMHVNRLIDYDYGVIDKVNFTATTVYTVTYECLLCSPIKELEIIGQLQNIIKGYLLLDNGPLIIAVKLSAIDERYFKVVDNNTVTIISTGKNLQKGQYLKVSIININSNLGERNITGVGKLINVASKEEIAQFKEEMKIINEEEYQEDEEGDEKEFI